MQTKQVLHDALKLSVKSKATLGDREIRCRSAVIVELSA